MGDAGMGEKMVNNSDSMTCKQLFNTFNQSLKRTDQQKGLRQDRRSYEELEDDETVDSPKRTSAHQLLENSGSNEEMGYDSGDQSSPTTPRRMPVTFRAHSPSPIRKRGSLLDLFSTQVDSNVALTCGTMGSPIQPKKLTSKEVDETYQGEIPNTPYSDLPPTFNEMTERRRIAELLVIERLDFQLSFFYKEMNDTAIKLGLRSTNFAVAHGMHHNDNYSSALDIAKLSK